MVVNRFGILDLGFWIGLLLVAEGFEGGDSHGHNFIALVHQVAEAVFGNNVGLYEHLHPVERFVGFFLYDRELRERVGRRPAAR